MFPSVCLTLHLRLSFFFVCSPVNLGEFLANAPWFCIYISASLSVNRAIQLRAADLSRFETVFFPLPGLFPLRPGIFSVSGILVASGVFVPLPPGFFSLRQKVFFTFPAFFLLPKSMFPAATRYFFRFGAGCDKAARKDRTQKSTEARQKTRKQTVTQNRHPKQQIQTKTRKQMSEQGRKQQHGTNQSTQATKQTKQPMYSATRRPSKAPASRLRCFVFNLRTNNSVCC